MNSGNAELCKNLFGVMWVLSGIFVVEIINKARSECANCAFLCCEERCQSGLITKAPYEWAVV